MDKYELAALLALNGLDGFSGKLTAQKQRNLFGFAPFGKKTVSFDCNDQGTVRLSFRTDPTNTETVKLSFNEVCDLINRQNVFKW